MRHVFAFILAVVLVGVLIAGGGWGVGRLGALQQDGTGLTSTSGAIALAVMLGAGLLIGLLLVVPAVSPLATGLPGLALIGWSVLLVVNTSRAERLLHLNGDIAAGVHTLLTSGVLALLGMAMVVPMFAPSRWRRRGSDGDDFAPRSTAGLLQ
jgi:hypothetical protein